MVKWFLKSLQTKNATLRSIVENLLNEELAANPEQEHGLDNMSAIILQI